MPFALKLVPDPNTERECAPDLRDSVRDALAAMTWLTDTDRAAQTLALRFAEEIEKAVEMNEELQRCWEHAAGERSVYQRIRRLEAMVDVSKTVGVLGPQLLATLKELGGTPPSRRALTPDKPVGSRLAQLRDAAGKHATPRVDDAEDLDAAAD